MCLSTNGDNRTFSPELTCVYIINVLNHVLSLSGPFNGAYLKGDGRTALLTARGGHVDLTRWPEECHVLPKCPH